MFDKFPINLEMFNFTDNNLNEFKCENKVIFLRLRNTKRWLRIGELVIRGLQDGTGGKVVVFKKMDEVKHEKSDSWSVPYDIFTRVDGIWVVSMHFNYKVLTKAVEDVKQFLHFKDKQELKVYIPRKLFNIERI